VKSFEDYLPDLKKGTDSCVEQHAFGKLGFDPKNAQLKGKQNLFSVGKLKIFCLPFQWSCVQLSKR